MLVTKLPELKIKGKIIKTPIIQGGMGIGVSMSPLAKAVSKEGGVGVISSAALDRLLSKRTGKKYTIYDAVYEEINLAKESDGVIGINIMVALARHYRETVIASVDAGVDIIISGGGLPLELPSICNVKDTALVPIVSSARSLELICKKWERYHYRPDAVIVEGPLAGGHLGFKIEQIDNEEYRLERLFLPIKDVAKKYGDFPIIVAGGIYSHDDIKYFLNLGADGVQLGTRFLASEESSASQEYKEAVVKARKEDIIVAYKPGSPCGLPFRIIKHSPMYVSTLNKIRSPKCDMGYVLSKDEHGNFTRCNAKSSDYTSFCICNGLLSSGNYNPEREEPLYTVGVNAYKVDSILPVKAIMDELKGINIA